jgi:5'/3'-nucleotidase
MKLLLTNDDGIDAPGLAALAEAAEPLGALTWVAPCSHLSGCGHRVTTDGPIRLTRHTDRRWAIDGTPADCVRVALAHVVPDVDWILSGLNAGGNLGADVFHSGTVAAVREAALHGKPGIALSQYRKRGLELDWPRTRRWLDRVLAELLARPTKPGTFWNVNLPHLPPDAPEPELIDCPLEAGPLPLSFRAEGDCLHYVGNYHQRQRQPGSDVDVCFAGNIAVTHLAVYG